MNCKSCQISAVMLEYGFSQILLLERENSVLRHQLEEMKKASNSDLNYSYNFKNGIVSASTPRCENIVALGSPVIGTTSFKKIRINRKLRFSRKNKVYVHKEDHPDKELVMTNDKQNWLDPKPLQKDLCQENLEAFSCQQLVPWKPIMEQSMVARDDVSADLKFDTGFQSKGKIKEMENNSTEDSDVTFFDSQDVQRASENGVKININVSNMQKESNDTSKKETMVPQTESFGEVTPEKEAKLQENLLKSFDIHPNWRKFASPTRYKYKESRVRKKADRKAMKGWSCPKCEEGYKMYFGVKNFDTQCRHLMQRVSKHRGRCDPISHTPEGFWDMNW